jgi:L,D-transpeptidase catalytic domain
VAEVLTKAVAVIALLVFAGGCSARSVSKSPGGQAEVRQAAAKQGRSDCSPGRELLLGDHRTAYAARVVGSTPAFARLGGRPLRSFGPRNANGVSTVFGVLAVAPDVRCEPAWYRVQLPVRPNGATGYVRARDVRLFVVHTRIEIDLSERQIDFFRNGRRVLRATAGVGAGQTPTPTGRFYVNQRLRAPDPSGPFGPGAIGISAFSPVLTEWAQGGPIAVHGTNDPSSIGRAATHGCLRIANAQLARMFVAMPEGTPVLVRS